MDSSQALMTNSGGFEEQEFLSQMGFIPFPPHMAYRSLKDFTIPTSLARDHQFTDQLLSSSTLSLQRSTANLWKWREVNGEGLRDRNLINGGDDGSNNGLGVSQVKIKKMKLRRKVREPRFCFKTMSEVDVLDDGYKWRKYGQKVVKNTQHPRSYYRCTQDKCRVKKRVERLAEDPRMVMTTYEGRHVHSPTPDLEDSQIPSPLNNLFW